MMKELVAKELAKRVKDGDVIGVGTGSTVDCAIAAIGTRAKKEKLAITVVPTSLQTSWGCEALGLSVLSPAYCGELSWGFDGADAVDSRRWLIKGKGGALLEEKILAAKCKKFIVIVDESKMFSDLAGACPIPLEVVPSARSLVEKSLGKLGASQFSVREGTGKKGPVITEHGNIIIDVAFPKITEKLDCDLKCILGVVETGLFIGYAHEVLVASSTGVKSI
ncbi:MAG: ribose-5-phosphate isomerase RpiA [Oligoflexia bacterium]|nr:ribose-5-phosphate isomerase RpiA [Oligoflexia bacterium]